ncbi:PREDICTED: protein bric-a-brac 1-like isoform X1 [Acromyrmex echinatior]|uniref:protein bric-a-brac 1-like isoform X1 n=1 Tax=Acromyrmex echinatior TaxID=103372 RepID=UPI000580EAE6|nr:PREDICTED: protein bric-a-brac 1-like isoform X1 [Acromyrmex echinatior]XP_011052441.1 PREDICTED: protein bric-a-brac 1-like isoform X1 [Acromyrmex echinatior]XP_011052442.1 PREDICTED: protein bric-a-brac 1-like isoform X1 [Acromyrmex echinatior]XP_011052443.1 PREDICTED: protein bric-a-brac 1-like isoform X1 [Acromyrmex echinatior]XP_011052445.1 PREDICTED: protein bric-a-brac 1-like isoform X1 [Acromyrmex echinatior]
MGSSQQFSLRWNNYLKHITCAFETLRSDEDLVDVTLSCEGKKIRAHKMLLSACSTYFRDLFKENPCQHPIIIFRNVKFDDLAALVDFMYQGEVNVIQEQLASFLTTAELLAVQGLTDGTGKDDTLVEDDIEIPNEPEVQLQNTSGKSTGDNKRNKSPSSPMPYHAVELQPEVPPNKRRKIRENMNVNAEKNSGINAKDSEKTAENQMGPGSDPVEIIPLMPNLKLEMPEYLEQDGSSCSYEDQSIGDNALNKIAIDDTSSTTPDHEQKVDISQTFYTSQSASDGLDSKHQDVGHLLSKPSTSGERATQDAVQESLKELAIYLSRCLPTRSSYLNTYCLEDEPPDRSSNPVTWNISRHKIQRKKGLARQVRKPCKRCCEKNITVLKNHKPVEVTTFCNDCSGKPHFCLRCFNIVHHITD